MSIIPASPFYHAIKDNIEHMFNIVNALSLPSACPADQQEFFYHTAAMARLIANGIPNRHSPTFDWAWGAMVDIKVHVLCYLQLYLFILLQNCIKDVYEAEMKDNHRLHCPPILYEVCVECGRADKEDDNFNFEVVNDLNLNKVETNHILPTWVMQWHRPGEFFLL